MTDIESYSASRERLLALYDQQDYWDAYRLVEDLLIQYPTSVELLVRRAMIIQLLNKEGDRQLPPLRLATQSLEAAHEIAPDAVDPLLELGHFAFAVDDDPAAGLNCFRAAQERAEKGLKEALVGQIKCHLDMGNMAQAMDLFERARQVFPDDDELEILHEELGN